MSRWITLCITAFLLYIPGQAQASGTINALTVMEGQGEYDPIPYISILKDGTGHMTISDVLSAQGQASFIESQSQIPNSGYSAPVHWIRLPIHNSSLEKDWLLRLEHPPLDRVDFYMADDFGSMLLQETGDAFPFGERAVRSRNFIFPFSVNPREDIVLYLRVETEGAMALPLTVVHPVQYAEHEQTAYLAMGIYYGMLVILILYNSVLAFSLRSKDYFYYVGINTMVLLLYVTLNGTAYQYVWPEAVWWNNRAIVFFICLSHIMTCLFARSFLEGKSHFPKLYRVFTYIMMYQLLNIIVLFWSYPIGLQMSMYTIWALDLFILAVGWLSWRKGFKPAGIFLLGWSLFMIGAIATSLADAGYIPYIGSVAYASQIGSALEAVILSWALASRIEKIRMEKEWAVEQMIETRHLAEHDELTGLYNRRYLITSYKDLFTSYSAVSVLLIDVDHFKRINDTFGHDIGDFVLQRVARLLQECFRPSDIVGRYGGEEFLVLLPGTNVEQAQRASEYVLKTLREYPIDIGGSNLGCTVSIGVSTWLDDDEDDDFQKVLRRADEALYRAKETGRNRVCVSGLKAQNV